MQLETLAAPAPGAEGRRLIGRAAVFDVDIPRGDHVAILRPGAFSMALGDGRDVLALFNHDWDRVLGRTKSGTLRLRQRGDGLHFELDPPDTMDGRDVLTLAMRGDLGGCSIGFNAVRQRWNKDRREILEADLQEVSIISAFPACDVTSVEAHKRSLGMSAARRRRLLGMIG